MLEIDEHAEGAGDDRVVLAQSLGDDRLGQVGRAHLDGRGDGFSIHHAVDHAGEGFVEVDELVAGLDVLGELVDASIDHGLRWHDHRVVEVLDDDIGGGTEPGVEGLSFAEIHEDLDLKGARAVGRDLALEPDLLDLAVVLTIGVGVDEDLRVLPDLDGCDVRLVDLCFEEHLREIRDLHDD